MTLSDFQLANISNSIVDALQAAIDEIVQTELDHIGIDDADTQFNVMYDVNSSHSGDIEELAELVTNCIGEAFTKEVEEKSAQLLEQYAECVLPIIKNVHEQDGQIDGPARRESWCNFVDAQAKDGFIGSEVARLVDADVEAL